MDAFIGEIRAFPFGFCPENWIECRGQQITLQEYPKLIAVIGSAFNPSNALPNQYYAPDLRGRVAMHAGQQAGGSMYKFAQTVGVASVTLTVEQIPAHRHVLQTWVSTSRTLEPSSGAVLGIPIYSYGSVTYGYPAYTPGVPNTTLAPDTLGDAGGHSSHTNLQPFMQMLYCICYESDFYPIKP